MVHLAWQIAVDRAAPQDEMSNMSYMSSVGGLGSLSQGAGGPMRGSNAPLQGSGYGSLSGNLDFSSGVSLLNAIKFFNHVLFTKKHVYMSQRYVNHLFVLWRFSGVVTAG